MIKLTKEEALESKTFCILPFNHLFVQPDGSVQPCCVSNKWSDASKITEKSIEEAFNGDNHRQLRKDMLEGIKNPICDTCYKNEEVTGNSTRIHSNGKLNIGTYSIPDINDDYTVEPDFQHLDIRFSNLCNLKCRMCNHVYSSSWYEDALKLGQVDKSVPKVVDVGDNIADRLKPHLNDIRTVYFAGGEPLLMKEHFETLKVMTEVLLKSTKTKNNIIPVSIHYNTNLKILRYGGTQFIEFWKNYKTVNLSISCDGVGEVGEYQRTGFETPKFIENLNTIRESGFTPLDTNNVIKTVHRGGKLLSYNFQYTVTPINILHLPDFIEHLLDRGYITTAETVDFRYAWAPEEFNIRNITNKELVEKTLRDRMYKYDGITRGRTDELIQYLNQDRVLDPKRILKYYDQLDELNPNVKYNSHKFITDILFTQNKI